MLSQEQQFIYHKKGFTAIEFIMYLGIIMFIFLLTTALFYAIIFYTGEYYDKTLLRTETFKILQKIYYNNTYSQLIETTTSSIKFIFSNGNYERLFASGSTMYIENQDKVDEFLTKNLILKNFNISTNGNYINIFLDIANEKESQENFFTSTIYKWSF